MRAITSLLTCFTLAICLLSLASAQPEKIDPSESNLPKVGDKAEDFALTNLAGEEIRLASELERGPVVLVVLRGYPGYQCPICTRQVGSLLAAKDELSNRKATVVLVYPGPDQNLEARAAEFVKKIEFPENFKFVVDPGYKFVESYNLRWDAPRETAYPSTFVIDQNQVITFAKISQTHGGRAETRSVLESLE